MNLKGIYKLLISLIVCQLAGLIGSVFTSISVSTWYASLNKPWFNPPNWIFAPVWTLLFVLMGISLYMVWKKGAKKSKTAIILFTAQLLLNVLWSVIFFGLMSPFFAFIEIMLLWFFIFFTILSFYRISRPAAYLLMPYILWVSFAAVLNFSIFLIN